MRAFAARRNRGAAAAVVRPRGRGKVEDLLAGTGLEVGIGLEAGQLGGEAVLDTVARHADVQLEGALDALQLFQLGRRSFEVLQSRIARISKS